jgi:hypothetical protein
MQFDDYSYRAYNKYVLIEDPNNVRSTSNEISARLTKLVDSDSNRGGLSEQDLKQIDRQGVYQKEALGVPTA